jgi:transposase InsO family protein
VVAVTASGRVVDLYLRVVAGWSAAIAKRVQLILDSVDKALWGRGRAGTLAGRACSTPAPTRPLERSVTTRSWSPDRLLRDGADQAPHPRHSLVDVELATAEWDDWSSNQRLHAGGDTSPHELP